MSTATKLRLYEIRMILDGLSDYNTSKETLPCDTYLSDQSVNIAEEFTSV
jgi:hypothetical protein